jgi:hypothetical protein
LTHPLATRFLYANTKANTKVGHVSDEREKFDAYQLVCE